MSESEIAEECRLRPAGELNGRSELSSAGWRDELRARIVSHGIRLVYGSSYDIPTSAAADVSLIRGGLRMAWLRALRVCGVKSVVASSGLGYPFVCHIGDLAEYPFYHRRAFEKELALCSAWLSQQDKPVVYDVGANVGFISTHLAQMLGSRSPQIFAFEPVPMTFIRLVESVRRLGLRDRVHAIAAAVIDAPRPVRMAYSQWNSLEAQVIFDGLAPAFNERIAYAAGITLDDFSAATGTHPTIVKMDIEGCEVAALRGAQRLLAHANRPAILFEHNPVSLRQCGATSSSFSGLLPGYAIYYVDDLLGQKLPFGNAVSDVGAIPWICNLFAVPRNEAAAARWLITLTEARYLLRCRHSSVPLERLSGNC